MPRVGRRHTGANSCTDRSSHRGGDLRSYRGEEQHRCCSIPSLLFLSVIMFLTGCSRSLIEPVEAYMMNKTTPPEDEAMVKSWVQRLREGKFGKNRTRS